MEYIEWLGPPAPPAPPTIAKKHVAALQFDVSLKVFPNPNSGSFEYALEAVNGAYKTYIYDLSGKQVYFEEFNLENETITSQDEEHIV